MNIKLASFCIFIFLSIPMLTLAHQPRIVDGNQVTVVDPTVSKAYYGTLAGESHSYTISAQEPFTLYVSILMPYTENSPKDVMAEIRSGEELLATIGGQDANWKSMFEFFGQSTYWDGGEYKTMAEAGEYTIVVSSPENNSKYSLAIGEIEAFTGSETISALQLIPELKQNFFNESPWTFIKSPLGWGYILVMYILSFGFGFAYRYLLRIFAKGSVRGLSTNLGKYDRVIRLAIWLGLLLWAITTTWSPWLLFFSGFALFEALFSWCGLYAALGRNTCPS